MSSEIASRITEGIRVNIRTAYVEDESSPKHRYYVYAYQVEIINESDSHVQLLSREWHIVDGYGKKQIVEGDGVVGKQPHLAPGETYKYVSGTHFQTTIGKMFGHYTMQRKVDNTTFKVDIPPFVMVFPFQNN